MLRYRSRKEAEEAGVHFDGPDSGSAAAPHSGGGDLGKSLRWRGGGDEAKPSAPDTPTRGLPRRPVRGRREDRKQHESVGGDVWEPGRALELNLEAPAVQPVDPCLALGQPTDTGSRRTLLAGEPFPLAPSVNSYWGSRVVFSQRHQRHMSLRYVSHEGKEFQEHIRRLLLEKRAWYRSKNPLHVRILVCFGNEIRSDIDNRVKVAMDAFMNGNLFVDDSQIETLEVRRGPAMKPATMFVWVAEFLPDRAANLSWIKSDR